MTDQLDDRTTDRPGDVALADVASDLRAEASEAEVARAEGLADSAEPEPLTQWQLFRRRFRKHKLAIASLLVLVLLFLVSFGIERIRDFEPLLTNLDNPANATPGREFWFGTDTLGRDYFTEVFYAGQTSLRIGLTVALISTVVGTIIGAIAGYYGGWIDQLLMRLTDLFLIIPALAVLAIAREKFGDSPTTISFVLAGLFWMWIARVVRGQTLSLKEKEFIEAAKAIGGSGPRIIARHILPNCLGAIVVNATLQIAVAIITESTLSFLGFGVDASWGNLLATAKGNYDNDTHLLYFPGLAILLTVLCVNALGDGLRDALDPHAKH